MTKENEFETMMIQSFFIVPYQIHKPRPIKSTTSIPIDTFSAFFSFRTFTSCGIRDAAVQTLAATPIIVSVFIYC